MNVPEFLNTDEKRNTARYRDMVNEVVSGDSSDFLAGLLRVLPGATLCRQYKILRFAAEIAGKRPPSLEQYIAVFIDFLDHSHTGVQSAAMTIIYALVPLRPQLVVDNLDVLQYAGKYGAVVARDYLIKTLVYLAGKDIYYETIIPLLLEWVRLAPENQMASYAEQAFTVIRKEDGESFESIILKRMQHTRVATKSKRLDILLKKQALRKK